jgi:hypothetical protein
MKASLAGLALVSIAMITGCTSSHHVSRATLHGTVSLVGGAPLSVQSGRRKTSGSVLLFTTASRSGAPAYMTDIHPDGTYSLQVQPGRYYLGTTAATFNGAPAGARSIAVNSGQDLKADISISIK